MMNRTRNLVMTAVCVAAMLPVTAGATVVFSDDFSSGSGFTTGGGSLEIGSTGWWGSGPESKAVNSVDANATDFSGKLGWDDSGAGFFDSAATSFSDLTLSGIGDYITLSLDYTTRGTLDQNVGVRLRLYDYDGLDLFANAVGGYGLNLSSGAGTGGSGGQIAYRTFPDAAPFGNGTLEGAAVATGTTTLGDGGTVSLTVTKTGDTEITLSGSWDGASANLVFAGVVAANNNFNFDALGVSVGSSAHGVEIDNVLVTSNIPEPATLGLIVCAGAALFTFRRRTRV